mmetsp:Transcript_32068/g.84001  ORF Transcript_32068/g.84001 Transcript_32068/m.84001 type:complete len:83 (+) Transcript_32068:249-497(+)
MRCPTRFVSTSSSTTTTITHHITSNQRCIGSVRLCNTGTFVYKAKRHPRDRHTRNSILNLEPKEIDKLKIGRGWPHMAASRE